MGEGKLSATAVMGEIEPAVFRMGEDVPLSDGLDQGRQA